MDDFTLTVSDVMMLINYEKQLGVFIFLNEAKLPPGKIKALREEKIRISDQIKRIK